MIRLTFLWMIVAAVAIYTWRDWFKGLCGLIVLVGVLEMPDVPRTMFGIGGLNFFNLLLVNLLAAWLIARHRENLKFDLPPHVGALLAIYLGVILIGFYRLYSHPSYMVETRAGLIQEYLINTLKWSLPGIMLFDGCRTKERTTLALLSVITIYLFLGAMVVKVMPIRAVMLDAAELQRLAYRLLVNRIGYHRVTLSMMLAGASWAVLAMRGLTKNLWLQALAIIASFCVLYAQGLTGGRAGYIAWAGVGLVLCVLRWRKYLMVAPVMVVLVLLLVPSVADRMLQGFNRDMFTSNVSVNDYDVTAGRVIIWPIVIDKIKQQMFFGYGRMGMWTTGVVAYVSIVLDEEFGHPHNAYLEWLLDNGVVGFIPVMLFYMVVLFHAFRVFVDRRSGIFMAAGGTAGALVLGLMGAGMGSQSFYPIEGTVGMWCAMGIMFRVSVNRRRALAAMPVASRVPVFQGGYGMDAGRAAAAAAMLESLLWPKSEPIVPIGTGVRARRPLPVAPGPEPEVFEPAAAKARPFVRARPATEMERVPSTDEADAGEPLVFEAIVPVRKSS
jgi:O-antigen ligase